MMLASSSARERSHAGENASEKRSLASILRTHGPLSVTDAVDVALDVCDELANAHAHGVVHGDLGLHRVRMSWPRSPKQPVDIFALDEDDSAAFAFRASAVAILVAPEQRAGRPVDLRADVWAVGAILHWMIAARPPSSTIGEGVLAGAPGMLVSTIEACLAHDPSKRPRSVDAIAEAIGSFASSPAERFEALAQRRAARDSARRIRADRADVGLVLGRLDDAALDREVHAASDWPTQGSVSRSVAERILSPTHRSTAGSVVVPKPARSSVPPPLPALAPLPALTPPLPALGPSESRSSSAPAVEVVDKTLPLALPETPAVRDSLAPVAGIQGSAFASLSSSKSLPWTRLAVTIGAIAAVAFGVAIGMRLVGGNGAHRDAGPAAASRAERAPVPTARVAPATTSSSEVHAVAPVVTPPVVTPASLPDARPTTPRSLPDAPAAPIFATPAPSAAPPRAMPPAPPIEEEPAPSDDEASSDDAP